MDKDVVANGGNTVNIAAKSNAVQVDGNEDGTKTETVAQSEAQTEGGVGHEDENTGDGESDIKIYLSRASNLTSTSRSQLLATCRSALKNEQCTDGGVRQAVSLQRRQEAASNERLRSGLHQNFHVKDLETFGEYLTAERAARVARASHGAARASLGFWHGVGAVCSSGAGCVGSA